MSNFVLIVSAVLFVLVIIAGVLFLYRLRLQRRGVVSRSLNMALIAIRFPLEQTAAGELNITQLREKIALMEQFYTHLNSIRDRRWWAVFLYGRPLFAMEINIPAMGEELTFYVAVARNFASAVEKIIQGVFPEALVERTRDYNIFHPDGVAAGATVSLKKSFYYPIRTYQKLEGDPIRAITNAFTKLAREGEGAALQIVARPADERWALAMREQVKRIYRGEKVSSSGLSAHTMLQRGVDAIDSLSAKPKTVDEQASSEARQKQKITPVEEQLAREIDGKASKMLYETNIRLLTAAPSSVRAEEIVHELEIAFEQFTDSNLNGFRVNLLSGRSLKQLIFNFSFRSFDPTKMVILGVEELTSIFHFQNVPLDTPKLSQARSREASAPANFSSDGLLLGYNVYRGEETKISLQGEDRRRHFYIIGQTGTGKSVFLKNMIIQDIQDGRGACVIDPHGDMVEDILGFIPRHRAQDVVYFNPGDIERPMGLNMLEYDVNYPEQKTFVVNELFSIFQKLYGGVPESMGPMFEQYFRNATMLVLEDPVSGSTMLEISRVMSDKGFRDLKLARAKNIIVKNFWTEIAEKAGGEGELRNIVPYITSKFDMFIANDIMRPIIAQQRSSFNFRSIMDNQQILLVNLSKGRLGDINSSLIGLIIVGKILMAALSRAEISEEKRKDFYLYIDEFQNVTTNSIATILSEARKYHLNLTITHQFIGQLQEEIKKAVFGNVGSMAAFRIGSDDAEFMAKQFAPVFTEHDLLNIENANCYLKLLMNGATSAPFSMKTYPPTVGDAEGAVIIKEISRIKYGRPREEIENEIKTRLQ